MKKEHNIYEKTLQKIDQLEKNIAEISTMGGPEMVQKQHELGKLTARERLDLLFDDGSFNEVRLFVKHRSSLFGLAGKTIHADGVITGYGKVNGRIVFVAAQDFTSSGGSLGEMHAKKIWKIMDMAIEAKKPFIALNDSGGARIQEGVPALDGYGGIFYRNTQASGYIPQITAVMGPTAGGAVYSPALTDWVFMVQNSSYMYITGPDVIKSIIGEEISHEDLGGPLIHSTKNGVCHFSTASDHDCIEKIKDLLSYLPDSCQSPLPMTDLGDTADRLVPELDHIIPDEASRSYNMQEIIRGIADNGQVLEPHSGWAHNIIVAFIRLMGQTVGVIANNPRFYAGVLDVHASDKAARFIRFCDAFNIPLLTLADVPGYMPGSRQEQLGIISHGAKLLHAYAEATVPKITVVIRKDYGGAYIAMCSKQLGADYVMAWPSAEIAVLGAEAACNIVYRKEILSAPDPQAKRFELARAYEEHFSNPYFSAGYGIVDEIIIPRYTRMKIISLLEAFKDKTRQPIAKKHNNIPL
ncbi:MAG: acyl-CoA carboxylase subunit beta [Syntrophaceae bacterium]|nr:acyl-CoA carboxylase subunit beta [Syntrophaceae bacterium]